MWEQNYVPLGGSLGWSALTAAVPIFVLLYLLGIRRRPSWVAALAGLVSAFLVAVLVYRMPMGTATSAAIYGAAFGVFPIVWIVFAAIFLYRLTLETGRFEVIKDSLGSLTTDRRLQALLVAFAFGAFLEGAAGFGTPVAVAAGMLAGLGFSPFYAAGICLLANTAPVAFGSIGIPIVTLAGITGLPIQSLSAGVGRVCAPISIFIPAYLVMVMGGWRAVRGVLPAVVGCGGGFALSQFLVSNFIGPQLTDIISSLVAMGIMVLLLKNWQPRDDFVLEGNHTVQGKPQKHSGSEVFQAWSPYVLLVVMVLLWGSGPVASVLNRVSIPIEWPGLHNAVMRMTPVVAEPSPYARGFQFQLAFSRRDVLFSGCCAECGRAADLPARLWEGAGRHGPADGTAHDDDFSRPGPGLPDELLGCDGDPGSGLCHDRAGFPVLQRHPGLARGVSDRFGYFGKCPVWESPGRDSTALEPERRFDGCRQFERWRHGKDDQPAEYCGGGRRRRIGQFGRIPVVSVYPAPQCHSGDGSRDRDPFLLVCNAGVGAVGHGSWFLVSGFWFNVICLGANTGAIPVRRRRNVWLGRLRTSAPRFRVPSRPGTLKMER